MGKLHVKLQLCGQLCGIIEVLGPEVLKKSALRIVKRNLFH